MQVQPGSQQQCLRIFPFIGTTPLHIGMNTGFLSRFKRIESGQPARKLRLGVKSIVVNNKERKKKTQKQDGIQSLHGFRIG